MTLRIKLSHLLLGLLVGALLAGGGYALATTRSTVIHACVNSKTRGLTLPARGRCPRGSRQVSWNQRGPRGATGARGPAGASGSPATISVGSVTTEPAGTPASVTNAGSGSNAILNFGIPQGPAGSSGTNTGPTAYGQVWMGSSSATVGSGSNNVSVGGGNGTAVVGITGCSAGGGSEPVITVTADHDPGDHLTGDNNNSSGVAEAYVTGWSVSGSVLNFGVSTYDPIHGSSANSDFSFTVYC
jgi:hypothetical protein